MPREQRWLEEGLATYLEPIVKVRHGLLAEREMWLALLENLPRGVAAGAHGGLDGSGSIDALYWGGALFWFLADLEIRERTGGVRSLRDSLAGILGAGGSIAASWELQRLLEQADRGAGVPVMKPLYERLGPAAFSQDLDSIWRRLGIVRDGESVRFDDEAPLAAIRRAIPRP
jgi:hypothetical protein